MTPQKDPPLPTIFWTIWFGILASIAYYQFTVGGGIPRGRNVDGELEPAFAFVIASIFVIGAASVRWIAITKGGSRRTLLVWMIVGLALSEAVVFFGIFIIPTGYPQTKVLFLVAGLLSIVQFAPFYAYSDANQPENFNDKG